MQEVFPEIYFAEHPYPAIVKLVYSLNFELLISILILANAAFIGWSTCRVSFALVHLSQMVQCVLLGTICHGRRAGKQRQLSMKGHEMIH